jgi:hypothetical protein
MIPASVIEFLTGWCVECDDYFIDESNCTDEDPACALRGHHRALVPEDFHWVICYRCHGDGFLRGWPGSYTESDRAEWSDDDYEDYRETRRRCEDCNGSGKVRDFTDEALERPVVQQALNDHYEMEATYRMEMRHCL